MVDEMRKFNANLKKYITQATILEKTHPAKSVPVWINVCEYIVTFAKSKNCPLMLRHTLVVRADQILARVKILSAKIHTISQEPSIQSKPTPSKASKSSIPFLVNDSPTGSESEVTEEDLLSLPDVPTDLPGNPPPPKKPPPNNFVPPKSPPAKKIDSTPSKALPPAVVPNNLPASPPTAAEQKQTLKDLDRIEKELKQIPANLKEVPAPQFNGVTSPVNEENELIFLDKTVVDVGSEKPDSNEPTMEIPSSFNTLKILGTVNPEDPQTFIPFDKSSDDTQPSSETADPFGPKSIEASDDTEKRVCFACGAPIEKEDKVCGQCGTPLE